MKSKKDKTKLIAAIEQTILDLKLNRKKYHHGDPCICNCGLLSQNLGISATDLYGLGYYSIEVCNITGEKLETVFAKLFEAGLSTHDIKNLENLSDEKILMESDIERGDVRRYDKGHVIFYFEAWLRILLREQTVIAEQAAPPTPIEKAKEIPAKPMGYTYVKKGEVIYENLQN